MNGKEFEGKKLVVDFAVLRGENNKNKVDTFYLKVDTFVEKSSEKFRKVQKIFRPFKELKILI